jgi:hypothetical protein
MRKKDKWEEAEKGKEEDYFLKKHREWLEKKRGGEEAAPNREDSSSPSCPCCGIALKKVPLQGGAVLYCSKCRGGWLDSELLRRYVGL